jgi:hypothetical protein
VIAAILNALVVLADLDHCARWVVSHGRIVCGDVQLDARCAWSGFHEFAQGIPVCVRGCGPDGAPTT